MQSKIFGYAPFDYKLCQEIFVTSVGVLKLNGQFRKKSLLRNASPGSLEFLTSL